ncbi:MULTISPECIES: sodium/proline symporter PutP [Halomonadaceae]|jgi:SSS family solute:Na+ symporter|uniref:sodium/proline symporter PutP n=1 Tax=Halomonadaceae TaxID=28256 RepID=UPI00111A4879|nr:MULTISPECIES: sodium/proline symporter PutP [Halomonas]MCG7577409.1 sodium/proline symporter PutP [Halomonas sp. MMH1-48]MCG7590996.1 sodium/proline symporter PutP [Halomonas sp. McD50-5]MCG7604508.1 sodium/proline symporter PutP [Halomonas sp. MM17-34]MCG7613906.1 sodium/proline symporter PutP [Halomonas sp. MM17-29]MCG7617108.1 sodium/proline symporter PutP [Halomonas sp. McD50-4]
MATGVWISLFGYFALMIAIGVYAMRKSTSSSEDYMLGGRTLSPQVAALSAGASDMSGWLLLGLPGAMFVSGLGSAWIGIGLLVGAFFNWLLVAPRLREQTIHYGNAITIPAFLANRFPTRALSLRTVSAIVIVIFFAVYTASGLVAGGKLFESAFTGVYNFGDMSNYAMGVVITLGVVLIYTVVGGFLAVSMTDFVQGCIMMLALIIMPAVVLFGEGGGGFSQASETLNSVDPTLLSWTTGLTFIGWLSAVTWGLGYFGQPHIIVRFMAIRSQKDVPIARNIGMGWMLVSLIGAVSLGLAGRAFAVRNGLDVQDPETIFIILANLLFHPLITGFLYAALLAAIMSTISSQLLVSSSSLTEDFYRLFLHKNATEQQCVAVGRVCVVLVGIVAAFIASDENSQVLGLVSNAWAGFGAAFGPLIILSLMWPRTNGAGAVAGMIVGAVTVMVWIALGWNGSFMGGPGVYEIIPGFIASFIAILVVSSVTADAGEYKHIDRQEA